MTSEHGLQKAIHEKVEQTHAAETKKYDRVAALAGDKRHELSEKKAAVTKTYNEWHQLNAAVNDSKNPDSEQFKALEAAAEKHARASKAFMDLQKEILAKKSAPPDSIVSAEAINALNAAAPSAAGRKPSKTAGRKSQKAAQRKLPK